MNLTREQLAQLTAELPASVVLQKQGGGGRSYSYVSGQYVITRLNQLFGFLGWALTVDECHLAQDDEGRHQARVKVSLAINLPGSSQAVIRQAWASATGHGLDGLDTAIKSAESGALKRAARTLGSQFAPDSERFDAGPVIRQDARFWADRSASEAVRDRQERRQAAKEGRAPVVAPAPSGGVVVQDAEQGPKPRDAEETRRAFNARLHAYIADLCSKHGVPKNVYPDIYRNLHTLGRAQACLSADSDWSEVGLDTLSYLIGFVGQLLMVDSFEQVWTEISREVARCTMS